VVCHVLDRFGEMSLVVKKNESLVHFVRACVVEVVHNARSLTKGTFDLKCTYCSGTYTFSSPDGPTRDGRAVTR
jgi:hypothetical protein